MRPAAARHGTARHGTALRPFRRAYELGFATTYMFAGRKPTFLLVDDITFAHPVDVGSLLRLHSAVVHASAAAAPGEVR